MNEHKYNARRRGHIVTCSALALVLAAAPLAFDLQQGGFHVNSAYAKSCFVAGTRVRMADGSLRAIEHVGVGDLVLGSDGRANRVVEVERVPLAGRLLHAFNGGPAFVTAEHPFMTTDGWRALDPAATAAENPGLRVKRLEVGNDLLAFAASDASAAGTYGSMALAPAPAVSLARLRLLRIRAVTAPADTTVYNLLLDGDHSYFADDYLVHNKGDGGGGAGGGGGGGGDSDSGSDSDGSGRSGGDDDGDRSGPGGDSDDSSERSRSRSESETEDQDDGSRTRTRTRTRSVDDTDDDSVSAGASDDDTASRTRTRTRSMAADVSAAGADLSRSDEAAAISSGWSN